MKVYLVIEYKDVASRVIGVYATRKAAAFKALRMGNKRDVRDQTTYALLSKNVKGLHGIKIVVDGKKRFLEANLVNKSK